MARCFSAPIPGRAVVAAGTSGQRDDGELLLRENEETQTNVCVQIYTSGICLVSHVCCIVNRESSIVPHVLVLCLTLRSFHSLGRLISASCLVLKGECRVFQIEAETKYCPFSFVLRISLIMRRACLWAVMSLPN